MAYVNGIVPHLGRAVTQKLNRLFYIFKKIPKKNSDEVESFLKRIGQCR